MSISISKAIGDGTETRSTCLLVYLPTCLPAHQPTCPLLHLYFIPTKIKIIIHSCPPLYFPLNRNYIIAKNKFTDIPTPFYSREGNSAILPNVSNRQMCGCTGFKSGNRPFNNDTVLPPTVTWHNLDTKTLFLLALSVVSWISFY